VFWELLRRGNPRRLARYEAGSCLGPSIESGAVIKKRCKGGMQVVVFEPSALNAKLCVEPVVREVVLSHMVTFLSAVWKKALQDRKTNGQISSWMKQVATGSNGYGSFEKSVVDRVFESREAEDVVAMSVAANMSMLSSVMGEGWTRDVQCDPRSIVSDTLRRTLVIASQDPAAFFRNRKNLDSTLGSQYQASVRKSMNWESILGRFREQSSLVYSSSEHDGSRCEKRIGSVMYSPSPVASETEPYAYATESDCRSSKVSPTRDPSEMGSVRPFEEPSERRSDVHVGPLSVKIVENGDSKARRESPQERGSVLPFKAPSEKGSVNPARLPSEKGSVSPVRSPSERGSVSPAREPSEKGSVSPAREPSEKGSVRPVREPSEKGSVRPAREPSEKRSVSPVRSPSEKGSVCPAREPSEKRSVSPVRSPSEKGSVRPAREPSEKRSVSPVRSPSEKGSVRPAREPSERGSDKLAAGSPEDDGNQFSFHTESLPFHSGAADYGFAGSESVSYYGRSEEHSVPEKTRSPFFHGVSPTLRN
jgi:hypothetical protein